MFQLIGALLVAYAGYRLVKYLYRRYPNTFPLINLLRKKKKQDEQEEEE